MNKHLTAIITALFIGTNINVNAAGGDVVLPAAIPVYVERFDWALGSGGNDGNWASKYMNTARSTWENMTLSSCTEANTCICVGTTSYEGKITLTDMPKTEGFVTMRAGSFLNEDRDKAAVILDNLIESTTTIDTEKFSCIRKVFYDTKTDRTLIIKGDDSRYNHRFYFDDLVVYSVTTDIEKLKTASRILLATEPYSKEQIQILQQVVKENKNLTSIDLWSIESVEEPFELQPANPNCIIYDPNHNVTNTVNVARCSGTKKDVNTYVCENLVIKDGYPFDAIYSFTATNVSYDREFANTGEDYFSTVCLPFAIDKDNPQIAKLLKFVELKQEDNQIIFDDADIIPANTPCVISVLDKQPFLNMKNVNARIEASTPRIIWKSVSDNASNAEKEEAARICKLYGTYETRTDISTNNEMIVYGFSGGKFVQVGEGCTFKPFRAYITADRNNAPALTKELNLATKNGWVNIKNIQNSSTNNETTVFSTDGILLRKAPTYSKAIENLPKGIYIINGNKTIIK